MDILKRLKAVAQERNITIAQLEKTAGFSNGSIGKWATSVPKVDSLYKIANIVNVPIEYFLLEEDASLREIKDANTISAEEQELIEIYRLLDERDQEDIYDSLYAKYRRTSHKKGSICSDCSSKASFDNKLNTESTG